MLKLAAVDYEVKHQDVVNMTFDSEATWLDFDVVVIDPSLLERFWRGAEHLPSGRVRLPREVEAAKGILVSRSNELRTLIRNGKLVIVFMSPLRSIEGRTQGSGTSIRITNYDWLPFDSSSFIRLISSGVGSSIYLKSPSHPIAPYYKAFKEELEYKAYLNTRKDDPKSLFLVNKSGNAVGISFSIGQGLLVFVPPPPDKVDASKLVGVIMQCAKTLIIKDFRTPEPDWARDFAIPGEPDVFTQIEEVKKRIEKLNRNKEGLELKAKSLSEFRSLLYEKGQLLEIIVIQSLRLMGFSAEKFRKDDMMHDIVIESLDPQGRALAEVEGKDDDAIHIEKMDQLTRVVDEDFSERGVYPEGLLIGNPYRLTHPDNRKDPFTDKVQKSAERKGFGLLTTVEIFRAVVKILQNPNDENFKTACRRQVLESRGRQICFSID